METLDYVVIEFVQITKEAILGDELIGSISYHQTGDKFVIIDDLYVYDNYRRQGVGTELVSRVLSDTTLPVKLRVERYDNDEMTDEDLINFFKNLGFYEFVTSENEVWLICY